MCFLLVHFSDHHEASQFSDEKNQNKAVPVKARLQLWPQKKKQRWQGYFFSVYKCFKNTFYDTSSSAGSCSVPGHFIHLRKGVLLYTHSFLNSPVIYYILVLLMWRSDTASCTTSHGPVCSFRWHAAPWLTEGVPWSLSFPLSPDAAMRQSFPVQPSPLALSLSLNTLLCCCRKGSALFLRPSSLSFLMFTLPIF